MEGFLRDKLEERKRLGTLRTLPITESGVDFLSNDYLGLARSAELGERIGEKMKANGFPGNGGSGSRLLSGNHSAYQSLEKFLARLFQGESALVFNSGYTANQALISSIAGKGDTIFYDRLSHVCLKEGAWLSKAQSYSFGHNDLRDLETKLVNAQGEKFVITESVFSMDGDEAPLEEMVSICKYHGAHLIVDEAHSTGIYGKGGAGYLVDKGLEREVFARVYTFGKGMGVHGACVVGSQTLTDYLINFGRPFIYTTSLPPHSVISIEESFHYLAEHPELQTMLHSKINLFKSLIKTTSDTCIQPILIPGNEEVRKAASVLMSSGFKVRPIVSPTVKEGTERLRICLHAFNEDDDIRNLTKSLNELV